MNQLLAMTERVICVDFAACVLLSLAANVLHKTSKGLREMNYQNTQQFERATMLQLPIQPLLVLCGVSGCPYLIIILKT
jgi:hypothetical protein